LKLPSSKRTLIAIIVAAAAVFASALVSKVLIGMLTKPLAPLP